MSVVQILDKNFEPFISEAQIQQAVHQMAEKMNASLKHEDVIFLGILNGAFLFAADLFRQIQFESQISFLKIASYVGTSSSGTVKRLIGINEDIAGKTVVVLEDIVDTGVTLDNILRQLKGYDPGKILTATLLLKPDALKINVPLDYVGFEIPNKFILGYGLDYNGYGRNLKGIYQLVE